MQIYIYGGLAILFVVGLFLAPKFVEWKQRYDEKKEIDEIEDDFQR